MATPTELSAVRNRRATLNPDGTITYNPSPGSIQKVEQNPIQAPPTALGNDASVMSAYQKLMGFTADEDRQKGDFSRRLTTNLDNSKKQRGQSLLNSRTSLNDRGIMNSGIALKRMEDLNTQYDTTDNQIQNNYNTSLGDLGRQENALRQGYQDAQVQASARATAAKAKAEADNLLAQQQAAQQAQQQQALIAALQGSIPQQDHIAAVAPTGATSGLSYAQAAAAYAAALARNAAAAKAAKAKASSAKVTQPKQVRVGGPQ